MNKRLAGIEEMDRNFCIQSYGRLPVGFVKGRGCRLWDTAGKEYIDLVSGIGVTILGHCHPAVTESICRQAETLVHTSNLYYVEPQARLARALSDSCFGGSCFFANSGAEANEGALKLARKYHFQRGTPRVKVVCLEGSFHGRTITTLSATGQPAKWEPFRPVVEGFEHVPLNDTAILERAVDAETAAVFLEPIQGESGVWPATGEYLEAARNACDRTGALLIFDEIQTGLGRTGRMFAYMNSGVVPDVMTVAKGLANGVPIGAFVAGEKCVDTLAPGDHASTFGGNFLATAAALATLETIVSEDLTSRAARIGAHARRTLEGIVERSPLAREVRGTGLMLAIQLEREVSREVVMGCMEKGVLVNNVNASAVRILPALVVTGEEIERGAEAIEEVLRTL